MKYLLDTNICVFVIRAKVPLVLQRFQQHLPDELVISSVTLAELRYGADKSHKPLYRQGMSRETIRDLFRVIDWMMDLPHDIALQFENELLLFEREKQMPYVTSIEQHGMEKGELIGQIRLYQQLLGVTSRGVA